MVQGAQQISAHPHTSASVYTHLSSRHLVDFLVLSGDIAEAKSSNRALFFKVALYKFSHYYYYNTIQYNTIVGSLVPSVLRDLTG